MKAFAELETRLSTLHKSFYLMSHDEALDRLTQIDADLEQYEKFIGKHFRFRSPDESERAYIDAVDGWIKENKPFFFPFYCVEICDYCCNHDDECKCRKSWSPDEEWGVISFGNTVTEALEGIIDYLDKYHNMNLKHL